MTTAYLVAAALFVAGLCVLGYLVRAESSAPFAGMADALIGTGLILMGLLTAGITALMEWMR